MSFKIARLSSSEIALIAYTAYGYLEEQHKNHIQITDIMFALVLRSEMLEYLIFAFLLNNYIVYKWTGLGSRSRSRSEPGVFGSLEPEPLEIKNKEPEPLGKKVRSRSR